MKNKVYYGEYSLKHWIDLMLKGNITLPPYQRHYVWSEEKVKKLILALQHEDFVPPVTIGAFKINGVNTNLILDGQQRLTSILLAYLELFPNRDYFKGEVETPLASDDTEENLDSEIQEKNIILWTFHKLLEVGNTKNKIHEKRSDLEYSSFDCKINENDFFNNIFLGFSYLVPDSSEDEKTQQKYFSTVFRSINISGQDLLPQESRKSLYFLDPQLVEFFEPDFAKLINITFGITKQKLDFIKYLSLLSQYSKDNGERYVAMYYSRKSLEPYYEEYIYAMVENNDSKFKTVEEIFQDKNYKPYFDKLEEAIRSLGLPHFRTIIEMDTYLFGLIYLILFDKKIIDISKSAELKKVLDDQIVIFKDDSSHLYSPNYLSHLRNRIATSIKIYQEYSIKNLD